MDKKDYYHKSNDEIKDQEKERSKTVTTSPANHLRIILRTTTTKGFRTYKKSPLIEAVFILKMGPHDRFLKTELKAFLMDGHTEAAMTYWFCWTDRRHRESFLTDQLQKFKDVYRVR